MDKKQIDEIITKRGARPAALIQVLLDIQEHDGWLSKAALNRVSDGLGVPMSRVQHAATFYKALRLLPKASNAVHVCDGTSCHIRGARRTVDAVRDATGTGPGETSPDLKFSLETPVCMGRCAQGPIVEIDGRNVPSTEAADLLGRIDQR